VSGRLNEALETFVFKKKVPHLTNEELGQFVQLLRESKLLSSCYHAFKNTDEWNELPSFLKKHLSSARVYSDRQAAQVIYETGIIQKALEDVNIYPIFLKGASYTLRKSENAAGRICSDLDVLVDKKELAEAEEALNQVGWQTKKLNDYDERYYREWSHEIPPMINLHRGTVIDLHHNIVLPISGRKPDIALLRKNFVTLDCGARVLSPEATILHSAVHLVINEDLSSAYRDVYDLVCLIRQYQTETFWEQLSKLASRLEFNRVLLIAMLLCQKMASIELPKSFINALSEHTNFKTAQWYVNYLLYYAIRPNSSFIANSRSKIAAKLVYVVGHTQKMPLPILIKHTAHKLYISLVEGLMGKFYLSK